MAIPWQPGYWETANETGEHGPPPERLEHDRIIPTRCSLWMKLLVQFPRLRPQTNESNPQWTFREMSVQDGWAYGRDAWLLFMTLMNETSDHPPEERSKRLQQVSREECTAFCRSLSDCQIRSWELLFDWWRGTYQDAELSRNARDFILNTPNLNIDSIQHNKSLYHQFLFCLWDAEFNPSGYQTGTSRGLDSNRRNAYEHALAQKAGILLLRELRDDNVQPGQQQCDQSLPKSYDVCPWLQRGDADNARQEYLPLYLWDIQENRTIRVSDLLKEVGSVSYTCVSHTWGRWKKKPLSSVHVPGVDGWVVPENDIFDVRELPAILRHTGSSNRFIWLDLVCLPQDTKSPENRSEVARQATIFHHASSCLAWINNVISWTNLRSSLRWLCLYFMRGGCSSDHYNVAKLLTEMSEIQSPIELIAISSGQGQFEQWITSTWTLQESCLFPDIILCNKN